VRSSDATGEFHMTWTSGELLWAPIVFLFWYAVIRVFVAVSAGIVRRDVPGWAKAGWILLVMLPPFVGVLVYLLTGEVQRLPRPRDVSRVSPVEYELFRCRAALS
jgi:hypothetical protein